MTYQNTFRKALNTDLSRLGMSEAALGRRLGISQQSINKWVLRGFPPMSRVGELKEILGNASEFAKIDHRELLGMSPRTSAPLAVGLVEAPSKHTAPLRGNPMHFVREYAAEQEADFYAAFPGVKQGPRGRTDPDYLSDKVAAELVFVRDGQAHKNTSSALLRVLVSKGDARAPVVVLVNGSGARNTPQLLSEASKLLGVTVLHATSGAEAAQFVMDLEAGDNPAERIREPED